MAKIDAAPVALRSRAPRTSLALHRERLLPANALSIVGQYDVVLEGSDNFATKFLVADACHLAGISVVHASAVRWVGTALAVQGGGQPCYRCLFEDLPPGGAANCGTAGVMGPVVGLVAAAQVDLALALLAGGTEASTAAGTLVTYDGWSDAVRRRRIPARRECALCGTDPRILAIAGETYTPAIGAA
jgi:adenylyltransferase/sulfurtransferase